MVVLKLPVGQVCLQYCDGSLWRCAGVYCNLPWGDGFELV